MRIAAIEPYAALSHLSFLEGLRAHSKHEFELFTLPARAWKWRMRTSSLHFRRVFQQILQQPGGAHRFDAFLVSDYLNLAEFRALLPPELRRIPAVVYFHENQLTYPLQPGETRDIHFALVHFHALLCAERALFNSGYHRRSFFEALEELLLYEPDVELTADLDEARAKSSVLPLGTEEARGEVRALRAGPPVILWTHRWEYDKDPDAFVDALDELVQRGEDFGVRLLGQRFRKKPPAYERLVELLGDRLLEDGFAQGRADYRAALDRSHVFVSTARHEFFGLGTLEALRAGLHPVLPDDLAYPELLPAELGPEELARFLYPRREGPVETLARALEEVRAGRALPARRALLAHTDRFSWSSLAARYDSLFEDLVGLAVR